MTVGEVVEALLKQDQSARIGVSITVANGWVADVRAVLVAADGTVCIDQTEDDINDREYTAAELPEPLARN